MFDTGSVATTGSHASSQHRDLEPRAHTHEQAQLVQPLLLSESYDPPFFKFAFPQRESVLKCF
jgi:hypothetical protein